MGKRKNQKSKRSVNRLPRGLPVKQPNASSGLHHSSNPFEQTHRQNKRAKFEVVNRPTHSKQSSNQQTTSALAQALAQRQKAVRDVLRQKGKANVFDDKRIGASSAAAGAQQYQQQSQQDAALARLVRERARRSKRARQFNLEDDDGNAEADEEVLLTHRGRAIDPQSAANHVMLSDDDEDDHGGNLDAYDTELHFGGGGSNSQRSKEASIYGNSAAAASSAAADLSTQYAQKKTDLDDLILRRKIAKAERLQSKERQVDAFTAMDEQFGELSELLQFRDREQDLRDRVQRQRAGTPLPREDREMAEWDREMKMYLHQTTRKVQAQDRTRTPEEVAREEADRLHALEARRLARMNGEFADGGDDDLSDVELSDGDSEAPKKHQKRKNRDHPEALDNDSSDDDDDDDDPNKLTTRFTADGLVQVDRNGVVVGKFGEVKKDETESARKQENDDNCNGAATVPLAAGARVTASYRASEQFDGSESWFGGTVSAVRKDAAGTVVVSYDIDYDDGDFEEGVAPRHVRPVDRTVDELQKEAAAKQAAATLQRKRQRAKEKARSEIPYVLEVPTTLDALHDMIANYATTGKDASLIIQRIHKANSVRLDRHNADKMQNFYDVLIRRFVAVGDAIHVSGNGGAELGRFAQLDVLTQTMYAMAQESPDMAGAVWSRRLGFFQNAHAKRLRDAALSREEGDDEEDEFTAWPSTGVVLALRALGHIFPVTDKRHYVVTPAILLLGQMISHTPLLSRRDLVLGTLCCGLLIEFTREAKRVAPEAHAFLSSIIRLFAPNVGKGRHSFPLPTFQAAATMEPFSTLRAAVSAKSDLGDLAPKLSLESEAIKGDDMPAALLFAALHLVETSVKNLAGSVSSAEKEVFAEITESVLALNESESTSNRKKKKSDSLPVLLRNKIAFVAQTLSTSLERTSKRAPLQRRAPGRSTVAVVKSLAPRLENPERYSLSKDKGKNATQAAADRARREYKREHKAVSRELQLDGAAMEQERRRVQHSRDAEAKAKRHKAFAWLEGEQGEMNQQVRQGGGLLQGGGMGAARAAAKSGKFGIKKGGKFR